jgi:hypothetical protein
VGLKILDSVSSTAASGTPLSAADFSGSFDMSCSDVTKALSDGGSFDGGAVRFDALPDDVF